ncbi:HAMP domain-containing sensor histidine kinase [Ruminococcus sp.]|uniref:sensor histidine kinase n=1 Tax=Ruminococcus sp. TaxID=41978 RepID=UPI0025FFB0C7|nr:HAMP domain-containing sensor histidine kinase [Ruminococcus sp.]MBQ6252391.1 HAMP domain-containing histidine kinase [Ruminococcus sp.]MBR6994525.1 HAMP domain-containing histidine kinase [Ruminococcus sp.]
MIYCLLCAAVVIILLCVKIYLLKKSAREISAQFADRLKNDTNNLIYVSSSDKDIRRLAESLSTQLSAMRTEELSYIQGNRELKSAVTNISHDLRTPLTAICGYLDLMQKTDDPEKQARYLSIMKERADMMKHLTEELFRYSVIVSDETELKTETVFVNQLLAESISSFYPTLSEKGIAPKISITEERVERKLDSDALSRVFSNLLNNAAKYSDGDLDITLTESGEITFSNTAKELSAVEVEQLFDRFYTVEAARHSTGLGLSIARSLIQRMGGSITAEYSDERLTIRIIL